MEQLRATVKEPKAVVDAETEDYRAADNGKPRI
jgi:hypothetical protein